MAFGLFNCMFGPSKAALDQPFQLRAGGRVNVGDGRVAVSLDRAGEPSPQLSIEAGFDQQRLALSGLPALIEGINSMYEVQLISSGPPPTLRVAPFVGLRITAPVATVSWAGAVARHPSGRASPAVPIAGVWALDQAALDALGRPFDLVRRELALVVRYPDGRTSSYSLEDLERIRFTADTGVHPSNPLERPGRPIPDAPVSDLRGRFSAELGPVLARPTARQELVLFATCANHRSNEVRLVLEP